MNVWVPIEYPSSNRSWDKCKNAVLSWNFGLKTQKNIKWLVGTLKHYFYQIKSSFMWSVMVLATKSMVIINIWWKSHSNIPPYSKTLHTRLSREGHYQGNPNYLIFIYYTVLERWPLLLGGDVWMWFSSDINYHHWFSS